MNTLFRNPEMLSALLAAMAIHAVILFVPFPEEKDPQVEADRSETSVEVFIVSMESLDEPELLPEPVKPPEPVKAMEPSTPVEPDPLPKVVNSPEAKPDLLSEPVVADEPVPLPETVEAVEDKSRPQDIPDEPETVPPSVILQPAYEGSDIEDLNPPSLKEKLKIPYPLMAQRRGQEGRVAVRIHVLADGSVDQLELIESSGHKLLDQAVLRKLRDHTFSPATRGGKPVAGAFNFSVRFMLD